MSWSFRKAGTDVAALMAAVFEEHAPQDVKERIAAQINAVKLQPHQAIVVLSAGHYETPSASPSWGKSTEETSVFVLPLIDTPLAP